MDAKASTSICIIGAKLRDKWKLDRPPRERGKYPFHPSMGKNYIRGRTGSMFAIFSLLHDGINNMCYVCTHTGTIQEHTIHDTYRVEYTKRARSEG